MEVIYKVLISIFSIIVLLSTGLSLTISIADEIEVNRYFVSVTETLINSHYNEEISQLLTEEAAEKGYLLNIEVFGSSTPGSHKYAKVTLDYFFEIHFFNISLPRTKEKLC